MIHPDLIAALVGERRRAAHAVRSPIGPAGYAASAKPAAPGTARPRGPDTAPLAG